jgi:hypothetical protein
MKLRRWIVGMGTVAVRAWAAPRGARAPTPSCLGEQV